MGVFFTIRLKITLVSSLISSHIRYNVYLERELFNGKPTHDAFSARKKIFRS